MSRRRSDSSSTKSPKPAIEAAIKNPSHIDMNLVNSQETRRMYDRIIGFKLSSLLQKKMSSKSAGRVQSVTLKMICDNDAEIKAFVPARILDDRCGP
jgi:DNA topoisomerase-1